MFFTAQSALAGCAIRPGGSDPLDPDPQAKGTKYTGPLVVYYDDNGTHTNDDDYDDDKICWFVSLRKGADLYSFAECSNYAYEIETESLSGSLSPGTFQQDAIDLIKLYFFQEVAMKEIYDCEPGIDCPTAVLKSYNQAVGFDDGPNPFGIWDYWMMNITVAVQD
jgi:hypothetical protein